MDENPYQPSLTYHPRKSHWHRFVLIPVFGVLGAIPGCVWVFWTLWNVDTASVVEDLFGGCAMIGVGGALGGIAPGTLRPSAFQP